MHVEHCAMCTAGVDESMVITLRFSRGRLAVCTCTVAVDLPNEAVVFGTKGSVRVSAPDTNAKEALLRSVEWLCSRFVCSGPRSYVVSYITDCKWERDAIPGS